MTDTVQGGAVTTLYEDYLALVSDLSGSPSGLSALNRSYHKHLLVAAASSLEDRIKRLVPEVFERHGSGWIGTFVAKQVMARGYHTLFDWPRESAQKFFSSFGEACGKNFKQVLRSDAVLKEEHDAFMLLGRLRNEVVHDDYASKLVELTPNEIMEKYGRALRFVDRIESLVIVVGGANGSSVPTQDAAE